MRILFRHEEVRSGFALVSPRDAVSSYVMIQDCMALMSVPLEMLDSMDYLSEMLVNQVSSVPDSTLPAFFNFTKDR